MKVNKEQIIREALHFFASHDYDRASLNDIAKALSITKGGIYHYFESKDDLFHQVILYMLDRMDALMGESMMGEQSLKEMLEPYFQLEEVAKLYSKAAGIDLLGEYSNVIYLIFTSIKKFPDVQQRMDQLYERYRYGMEILFRDAQSRGEIRRDQDPAGLAFEVTAFIEGGMLLTAVQERLDGNRMGGLVFENFWKRITAG